MQGRYKNLLTQKEKSHSYLWMPKKILKEELRHLRKKIYSLEKQNQKNSRDSTKSWKTPARIWVFTVKVRTHKEEVLWESSDEKLYSKSSQINLSLNYTYMCGVQGLIQRGLILTNLYKRWLLKQASLEMKSISRFPVGFWSFICFGNGVLAVEQPSPYIKQKTGCISKETKKPEATSLDSPKEQPNCQKKNRLLPVDGLLPKSHNK